MLDAARVSHRGETDMTLKELRHDIRNQLNAIKLSSALLHRAPDKELTQQSLEDIDRAADRINELVTRFLGDADAPSLLAGRSSGKQ